MALEPQDDFTGTTSHVAGTAGSDVESTAVASDATLSVRASVPPAPDLAWWQRAVLYECYPKSFQDTRGQGVGTIRGIIERLDYLQELGIGALWLTPVYPSPMKDNGYDVADYKGISPEFGTMDDMDELIAKAADRGIRIVMDLVLNHTSDEHEWFRESASSRENPKADWYIWRDPLPDGSAPTNWRSHFGGSVWSWCEERQQYYYHTFGDFQPDLNWENPQVREALYDVARFWLAKGVGGFRLDAVVYVKKGAYVDLPPDGPDGLHNAHDATCNTPGCLDFLREFRHRTVDGTDAFLVGEAAGVSAAELPEWVGPDGAFSIIIEYNHIHAVRGYENDWFRLPGWRLSDLTSVLTASQVATEGRGWNCVYFESHDNPRSPSQFFWYPGHDEAKAKLLGLVLLTLRGTPFIFQGEEIGMTNEHKKTMEEYTDIETWGQYRRALEYGIEPQRATELVAAYSRDNSRSPMQWDTSENAGFTTGRPWLPVHGDYLTVNAATEAADPGSTLCHYRRLVALRNSSPLLVAGAFRDLLPGDEALYAYERALGDERAVIVANFTPEPQTYDPALVEGLRPVITTTGYAEDVVAGRLDPLQGVIFLNT